MNKALARLLKKADWEICNLAEKQLEQICLHAEEGRHCDAARMRHRPEAYRRIRAVQPRDARMEARYADVRDSIELPVGASA
jgi:hypothetical protein